MHDRACMQLTQQSPLLAHERTSGHVQQVQQVQHKSFDCVQMRSDAFSVDSEYPQAMNSGSSMRSTTRANAPCTLGGLRLSRGTSVPLVPGKNVAKTSCYNATVIRFRVSV